MLKQLALALLFLAAPLRAEPLIGMAFPPVVDSAQRNFTISALKDLGIRHIRISDTWERRGLRPDLSDFAPLQQRISQLRAAGLKVMLTIELHAPAAACGVRNKFACMIKPDAPFEAYLQTLLKAVGDDLDAIQIANEWDNRFPGDAEAFLQVHRRAAQVIRAQRPNMTLVLGGITGNAPYVHAWCERGLSPDVPDVDMAPHKAKFCAGTSNKTAMVERVLAKADYDVVDLHLYDAPGLWAAAVDWVGKRSKTRTIWVTEFGGPHPQIEPSNPTYQAARLVKYLDKIKTLPVTRAYYFKLTDDPSSYHSASGLYDRRGRAKPALAVFKQRVR